MRKAGWVLSAKKVGSRCAVRVSPPAPTCSLSSPRRSCRRSRPTLTESPCDSHKRSAAQVTASSFRGRAALDAASSHSRTGAPRRPAQVAHDFQHLVSIPVGHTAQSRREFCTTPTSRHCRGRHAASRGDAARRHLLRALVQLHRTPRDPAKTHDMYFTFDDLAIAHSPTYTSRWPPTTTVRSGGRWNTPVRSAALLASQRNRVRRHRGSVGTSLRVRRSDERK